MEHTYSWDNWPLDAEVGDDKDLAEQYHTITDAEDQFLRDILQQPALSCGSESGSQHFVPNSNNVTDGSGSSSFSSNEIDGSDGSGKRLRPSSTSPRRRTYILSFEKSTIIPARPEPFLGHELEPMGTRFPKCNSPLSSKKRNLENLNSEPKPKATRGEGGKKIRSDSQTLDHIIAERKRRQELTQKFIALSATIPGLKKMDKTSILGEAISYVKLLQERVKELEERSKRGKESTLILKKTDLYANDQDTTLSETNSEECCELLPDVKAKVLDNEVLIEIHCEKENGIELKTLDLLESLHLFVIGSSVLPFGNSTVGITIIAQMGDAYNMMVNDLVKTLRQVLLNR